MTEAEIEKYKVDFEKKYEKYYEEYQEWASSSKYNAYHKYQDLADICRLAIDKVQEAGANRIRRLENVQAYINRLEKKEYSFEDVKKMLYEVGSF